VSERQTTVELVGDRGIHVERTVDAPRALVFKVWTDPEHLSRWWGPRGFATITKSMDTRPGGQWRYTMRGPDGREYENLITYLEFAPPSRVSYKHGGDKETEPINFRVDVEFFDEGGRTRIVMRMSFPSAEARELVIKEYGALDGASQTMARLGEHLAAISAGGGAGDTFEVNAVYNAPLEALWNAWTDRDQLMKWFGPKGTSISACSLDLKPGGVFHYCIKTPDGKDMWGRWLFREIVPEERLVYVSSFSDPQGGVTRAPFKDEWPPEMLSIVTFVPHAGTGRGSVVTIRWEPLNPTFGEKATFERSRDSMRQGWTGTFEKLARHLAAARR